MTNSMNNVNNVLALLQSNATLLKEEIISQYQVGIEVDQNDIHKLLSVLKSNGWIQLSYLSAIDWIEENKFELVYIVFNWEQPVHVQLRTKIDRDNPVMPSIISIYEGCKYYEREAHEFFGIKFPGNDSYHKQLVLEQWDDMPPLRKDFDPRAYSDKKFIKRDYSNKHVELQNNDSKKQQRVARKEHITTVMKGGKK